MGRDKVRDRLDRPVVTPSQAIGHPSGLCRLSGRPGAVLTADCPLRRASAVSDRLGGSAQLALALVMSFDRRL